MNRLDRYADWLVQNADKKGTADFDAVANAYRELRGSAAAQPPAVAPQEESGFFRQALDVPVGIAKGAVQGVRMIADAFGAGSSASNAIRGVEDYIGGLMSAQSKQDSQEIARIMQEAEDKGVGDQLKAALNAFMTAPVDLISQGLGTAAPVILSALGSKILGAGALAVRGVGLGAGMTMGAGVTKGVIYDEVKQALKEADVPEEQAEARAQLAQSYGGENLGMILAGTALGGIGAVTGIEKPAAAALARRIMGKAAATEAAEKVATEGVETAAKQGIARRYGTAMAAEGVPEFLQGSQEELAANIALGREGFDVDPMRGVFGAGALEGLVGAGMGASVQAVTGGERPVTPPPATPATPATPEALPADAAYEELVLERERLRGLRQTPEVKAQIAEIDKRAQAILVTSLADREKAAQSAFSQEDQQVTMREFAGDAPTEPGVATTESEAAPAPKEMTLQEAIKARVPTMQMPLMFDQSVDATPEEMIVPGAITLEELQGIGKPMRTSKSWFEQNVVGKTPEQVQAMVDADPKLIEGKTARAQVLREILAPKPAEFVEAPDAQTGRGVGLEPTIDGQTDESGVGTPVRQPAVTDTAGVEALDGAGVVPAGRDAGPQPAAPRAAPLAVTEQDAAFDELVRAVQDEASPDYAEAGQILEANRNNPVFLRGYDAAVRRAQGLPPLELAQQAPAPLPETPRGMPPRRDDAQPTTAVDAQPVDRTQLEPIGTLPGGVAARGAQQMIEPMSDADARRLMVARQAQARNEARAQQQDAPAPPTDSLTMPLFPEGPQVAVEGTGRGVVTQPLIDAAQAGDTRAALNEIATGKGFSPLDKLVANRLKRRSNLPKLEVNSSIDASGRYFPSSDTAVVREVDSHTVLHEVVHGFVHRLIAAENAGTVQNAGVRKLRAVMEYVGKVNPKLANTYGFKNLSEFSAEAMSNPEFQAELQKIPYQRTNAFTEFAKSVLRMLGLNPTTENTALAESLIAVDSMLDTGRDLQIAEAGTNVEPGMGDTPAVRRESKQDRTPTPEGVQAMEIVESLGMNPPADPTIKEQVLKSWDNAIENPKQVAQDAKSALRRARNSFETSVWSSDAAMQNDIRSNVLEQFGDTAEATGILLSISTAQANGSEAIAGQFLADGAITYDSAVNKWVTQESRDNMISLSRSLDVLAEKYGLTKKQAEQVGHTAFVARRLDGLSKSNDALYARAERLRDQKRNKEADALDAQAKYIHMTPEQIADGLELVRLMPELQVTIDHWNGYRSNTLDGAVIGGLMSRADAEAWMDAMDYVPFYRDSQLEEGKGPREYARSLLVQKDKKFKGSAQPVHDVFDNMARWSQYLISRAVKNRTGLALANQAVESGIATRIDSSQMTTAEKRTHQIVRLFENGEVVEFSMADPLYMPAFEGLQAVSIPVLRFATKFATVLRQSVVLNPLFSAAQIPQDSLAAMFTSGLSPRFALSIPARTVREFVKTLAGTSQTHNMLKKYGVVGQRDVTAAVVRMDAEVLAGLRESSGFKETLMRRLHHIAMASDNAVRQAVFEAAEAQGLSRGAAIEKAYQIINFRNRGSSKALAAAAQMIPFFTAYLAATHVMYKTVTGAGTSPQVRAEGLKRLAAMSGSVFAMSIMYAMLLGGDDDYEDTRTQIRDRMLMIPGTGAGIPLRSDVFLLPKVLGENLYQAISEDGFTDGARLRDSMQEIFVNSVLSPTVVPQVFKPMVEVGINHSFFTGRPLIGAYEQQMEKGRQYSEYTSELGKALGSSGVVSPIAVDHLIRGVLGSLGGAILYTTNQLMHNDPEVERPDLSTRDLIGTVPGMASFVTKSTENGLKNDFYQLREATRRADRTFRDLEKRSPHLIDGFLKDKKNLARISLSRDVEQIARELSQIRKDIVEVSNAPTVLMDSKKKREIITELRSVEKQLMKAIPLRELRKMADL